MSGYRIAWSNSVGGVTTRATGHKILATLEDAEAELERLNRFYDGLGLRHWIVKADGTTPAPSLPLDATP